MARKPAKPQTVTAYSYIRWSSLDQRRGHSLERQTVLRDAWLAKNPGVVLDTQLNMRDEGVSAFTGTHRENPDRNALAAFLRLVEKGLIPRGSYLIVEALDRLSREHIRPALTLLLNLIDRGIRVVQLLPVEAVYDDKVEPMNLMMAIMELSRGHSESQIKSERVGRAWRKKKELAAATREPITHATPSWLRVTGGRFEVIPAAADAVRYVYRLAAEGHGISVITRRLVDEGVPAFGRSGEWSRATVAKILKSRAVCGEYQPRRGSNSKTRKPDGPPIPNYFPAVVSEQQWRAARSAMTARQIPRGPAGKGINLFGGLLRDARDGGPIYRTDKGDGGGGPKLVNKLAMEGKGGRYVAFPLPVFEWAVLKKLREIDPREILDAAAGQEDAVGLQSRLADITGRIERIKAQMKSGDEEVGPLVAVLRELDDEWQATERELAERLRESATPTADAWRECKDLLAVLDKAADPREARLRLRSALRRVVADARCLFVARGVSRLAAVQFFFVGGRQRSYLISHRPAHGRSGTPARSEVKSFSDVFTAGAFDLRDPAHARDLEAVLLTLDPG